jgi:hypothetical protein
MLYFPQLSTAATAQYPAVKQRRRRTIVNQGGDGRKWKLADPAASVVEWELWFEGLTDAEWAAIAALFETVRGRAGEFTFLDPTDNLLVWSEDLSAAAWTKDPMIQVTGGVTDPTGGAAASRVVNPGQAPLRIKQTIAAPAGLIYCLSARVRDPGGSTVTLFQNADGAEQTTLFRATGQWTPVASSGALASIGETMTFGFELAPGGAIELYGIQAEAQVNSSPYKRTLSRGGIYPQARFSDDALSVTASGPKQHSVTIRIESRT